MNEAYIALIAALGAAFLTAAGSLGVVRYQEKLRSQSADADALAATVTELLSRSFGLALRARTAGEAAKRRSGLSEGVEVTMRQRKPVDMLELHDWFEKDFAPLVAAWSELWGRGDQGLVNAGNLLLGACTDVVSAATASMPAPDVGTKMRRLVRGEVWTPQMTERLEAAERALGGARRHLTVVARRQLDRPIVDPFGVDAPPEPS